MSPLRMVPIVGTPTSYSRWASLSTGGVPLLESVRQQRHRDENDHVRADDRHEPRDRSGDRHEEAKLPPVALQCSAQLFVRSQRLSALPIRSRQVANAPLWCSVYSMLHRRAIGCCSVQSMLHRRAIGRSAAQQPSPFSARAGRALGFRYLSVDSAVPQHSRTVALFCLSPHCGPLSTPPVL